MNNELERYLYEDDDAYDNNRYGKSVHQKDTTRYNKAKEQAGLPVVAKEKIIDIIKNFFSKIGITTAENPVISLKDIDYLKIKEEFNLKDKRDLIWIKFTKDGYVGVVATSDDINFDIPKDSSDYNKRHKVYNSYSKKYEDKWVYNTSGIIVHKLGKEWDDSFVLVFPLKNIPVGYTRGDIEKAVGNLLIEKKIPILDYYSHLY